MKEKINLDIIETNNAPAAAGPYSQAVGAGGFLFVSGQLGIVPDTGVLADGGTIEQSEQACRNIEAVLNAAGVSMEAVVKTTCFITDMEDFAGFNSVYEKYFVKCPARSCIEATGLPKGAAVEMEVIAKL